MPKKKILAIEVDLPFDDDVECVPFDSGVAGLDWDVIILSPRVSDLISEVSKLYKGKPSLSDVDSFEIPERCQHWRRELQAAVDAGKTVVVFLDELEEFYVDTGER